MASIKFNNIEVFDSNGKVTSAGMPSGSVIQTVYNESSDLDSTTANYASTWDDSNISASITPRSATNYLLIHGVVNGGNSNSSYALGLRFYISGGGTDGAIGVPASGVGNRVEVTSGGPQPNGAHQVTNYSFMTRIRCNDSTPNWSSGALTVKIQFARNSGGTARINESGAASTTTDYTNTISSLTIYEIQG
tara:strand:+ start:176 stop:751 length:576 start_codon:yes stop_codon:yes gene_type:complete